MLENFFRRFKQDNGIAAEVETSPYINVEGLEGKIRVGEPSKDDKKWARRMKDATSANVTQALDAAIAEGNNWRVWYLLNRPLREEKEVFFITIREKGFGAEGAIEAGLASAAQHNNVTAAYLLLKFAERSETEKQEKEADKPQAGNDSIVRDRVAQYAVSALHDAADKPGSDVFALLARTFTTLHDKEMHPEAPATVLDYQLVMKEAAVRAASEGHTGHLDALLENRLLCPQQFVDAYMDSFNFEQKLGGAPEIAPKGRKELLEWMAEKGIVDHIFIDEAKMVETRMTDAQKFAEAAAAQGWKQSNRELPLEGGGTVKPDPSHQAEITMLEKGFEGAVTYVFNYAAGRAHRIHGALTQEIPAEKIDPALAEQGKQFLECLQTEAPAVEWKKGEPFRLRFKHTPLPQP